MHSAAVSVLGRGRDDHSSLQAGPGRIEDRKLAQDADVEFLANGEE